MKNLKMKSLTLGILATVMISSTPVFAATSTITTSKTVTTKTFTISKANSVSKTFTIPGIIQPNFNYGPTGGPDADTILENGGVIQEGDEGQAVLEVQDALAAKNFLPRSGVDGIFGSQTRDAVINFQKNHSDLKVDGIVGEKTWIDLEP